MRTAITESPGSPRRLAAVLALTLIFPALLAQSPQPTAKKPAQKLYTQRGKIKSLDSNKVILEAVDLPPQTFTLTPNTDNGKLTVGELVQVTFYTEGEVKFARSIAEIVATSVNLPHGTSSRTARSASSAVPHGTAAKGASATSAAVNLPRGSVREDGASVADVNLPTESGAGPAPVSAAPISLAADESQMIHMHAPEIHQSGVRDPIRLAIFDFQPESTPDLTPEIATSVSDRVSGLLQNDGLFVLLDRGKLPPPPAVDLTDPAAIISLAKSLDHPDAILLGEIKEEIPAEPQADGARRRKIKIVNPSVLLEGRLYDAHTGHLLGTPQGGGGGSQDRPDERSSPLLRAIRDGVEALAAAIDPEYPPLLDPRTFATVVSVDSSHLTVAFPGVPSVQLGNRLQVSHPIWFTRDPATGNLIAVSSEPLGTLTVTSVERSEASGTYQGMAPIPGQTIRLSR